MILKADIKEPEHIHNFIFSGYSEDRCQCGALRISEYELERRTKEWQAYYGSVKLTDSYYDHKELMQAWRDKDRSKVKELAKKAESRLKEDKYLDRPKFPDPETYIYIIK